MNAFRLVVQPFDVYQITEFYVHKEVNKHIVMFLKGYILKEDADILQRRQMFHQEIVVDLQERKQKRCFAELLWIWGCVWMEICMRLK